MALLFAIVILSTTAGCTKEKETKWGIYNEPIETKPLPDAVGANELSVVWQREIGKAADKGYAILTPSFADGAVFAVNRRGQVSRLDGANGKPQWKSSAGKPAFAGVGVGEGLALVALDDGSLLALDIGSGEERWRVELNRQVSAVPVAGSGRVVVRTSDGLLIGLESDSGEKVWELERKVPGLSLHGDSQPLIDRDAVVTGLANGKIMVNSVVNGREFWEKDISYVRGVNELERISDIDSPPVVEGNTLYAATYQGELVSLSILTAETDWRYEISTRLPISIVDGSLLITDDLGTVVSLDRDSGEENWRQPGFQGRGVSNPLGWQNRVVIGDARGNIHLLDAEDGTLLQTRRVDRDPIVSLQSTDNNGVLAFSSGGKVVLLQITSQ